MRLERRNQRAFTIAELLVAVAITALIVVLLGTIFGSLIKTAGSASQRIDAYRDARSALQIMRKDFAATIKAHPAPYLEIDKDPAGPDVRQLCGLVAAKNQPSGTPLPAPGDTCAVRYYSAWNNAGYVLHRYCLDSAQTLSAFRANISNGILGYTSGTALFYPQNAAPVDEAIATYAWDLQVIAFDSAGNVINSAPDVFGFYTTGVPASWDPDPSSGGSPLSVPDSIEISFKALSADAARSVIAATSNRTDAYNVWMVVDNNSPASGDVTLYNDLIKPHAQDFRTRIYLK